MFTSRHLASSLLALLALVICASTAAAQSIGPGAPYPAVSAASDQKAGALLVYNLYSSSATSPNAENTRINIANVHPSVSAVVHFFFIDGGNCAPADSFVCLTPNQTASFLASDIDPGVMGYIIALAVSRSTGCAINFNYLIGDEYVKLASVHAANLGAEAFAAIEPNPCILNPDGATAKLYFGVLCYNAAPRVLAVDSLASPSDGNAPLLVLNRFGGNLATGAGGIGSIFGIIYNDAEKPFSFSASGGCQFKQVLSDAFPRTVPRISSIMPSGHTGWLKVYSTSTDEGTPRAILGAVINFNGSAATTATAFNSGHNLHKLTLTEVPVCIEIPVFPPGC